MNENDHGERAAGEADESAAVDPAWHDGQSQGSEADHEEAGPGPGGLAEYCLGVICPCECGKSTVLSSPRAIEAALSGASFKVICENCAVTLQYNPAASSPRMRPQAVSGQNRHQRRAMAAQSGGAPSGFRRNGSLIVPR